jgi:hypothetical protein
MAFSSLDSIVIDRAIKGTMFDSVTGKMIFNVEMIKDPNIEISGTTVFADDHLGTHIMSFNRAKEAKFSASNALFNLGLAAAQYGSTKNVAGVGTEITTPIYEEILVGATEGTANATVTLSQTPVTDSVLWIYKLDGKNIGTAYSVATNASATEFKIVGTTVTLPTTTGAFLATDTMAVWYEYEADSAVSVENGADVFAKSGRFDLEAIVHDPCSKDIQYHAHFIFPNAQLEGNSTTNLTTEGDHPFSFVAIQDYCATGQQLFSIIIPDVDED